MYKIKHLATLPGTDNNTVTHLFYIEGSHYLVVADSDDPIDDIRPLDVTKLEPTEVYMSGEVKETIQHHS